MNIFHKVTLESMKKSRTRTLVTIIGVALSAAMITGVVTFGVSLLDYLARGASIKYGSWQVAFPNVTAQFASEMAQNEEVSQSVAYENIGYAKLEGSKNPDKPYLFIAGIKEEDPKMLPVRLLAGRMPENSQEVVLSGSVLHNGGVKVSVGDTLKLEVGQRMSGSQMLSQNEAYRYEKEKLVATKSQSYKVVGISQRMGFENYMAPGYTILTKTDGSTMQDQVSLFVTLKNPHHLTRYLKGTAGQEAHYINDNVLRFMGLAEDHLFNTLLYSVGGVVVLIIMVGSIFLIYNSFNISLNERMHQFGILASVGATEKQLRNAVLFEGGCIGMIGIPIGILLGIGCIDLVMEILSKNFSQIMYEGVTIHLVLSMLAIIAAAIISYVTILISAYIPAKKAASMPVMDCIRQTTEVKLSARKVKTSSWMQKLYGLEGTLALKNFKRNKKRYRSVVLSLVFSMVLFISVNTFVIYLKQESGKAAVFTTYDIGIDTSNMSDQEMIGLYEKLKDTKDVYESGYSTLLEEQGLVAGNDLTDAYWSVSGQKKTEEMVKLPMEIQFLEEQSYLKIIEGLGLDPAEYESGQGKAIAVAKIDDNSKGIKEISDFRDLMQFDQIDFTLLPQKKNDSDQGETIKLSIVEAVPPDTLPPVRNPRRDLCILKILAPYSMKDAWGLGGDEILAKGLTFSSKHPTLSTKQMEETIVGLGITKDYQIYNNSQLMDESRNYIFIANVFSYTFSGMISLIAVANVFNTISTNIKLRRRELAMLRSVGMGDKDFQKMMNFECFFYGARALGIGLPLSILAILFIYKQMCLGGIEKLEFRWPWVSILISVVGVMLIVFVTMLYAISQLKKENIIEALRDDME